MSRQIIKRAPNDYDTLYSGAGKINDNFEELYDSVSALEVTGEIQPDNLNFLYHSMLMTSSFNECYFDIFREEGTVTLGGVSDPVFDLERQYYTGYAGSELYTQVVSAAPPSASSFYIYVENETDLPYDVQYSVDGAIWTTCTASVTANDIVYLESYYNELWIKLIWGGTGHIDSFGVLYDKENDVFISKTRFLTTYVAPSAISSGTIFIIPEDNSYTVDGKSMDVFRNGLRLSDGVHYNELTSSTIRWLIDIDVDDVINFSEQFGYVDATDDNRVLILQEHDDYGNHALNDAALSTRLGVKLVGTELLVTDKDDPTYSITTSITTDIDGNVTQTTETSSLGSRVTNFSYNIDGNLERVTLTVNGTLVKTTTFTYSGGELTQYTEIYNT